VILHEVYGFLAAGDTTLNWGMLCHVSGWEQDMAIQTVL